MSIKQILDYYDYQIDSNDQKLIDFFMENGYCIITKSDFVVDNLIEFRDIIDSLIEKESWRGGWEGKEQYMKVNKKFNVGSNRLGNLFNKNKLFLKLLTEKNILKIVYGIMNEDIKFGALDMREPIKNSGFQEFHIDWYPKKSEDDPIENIICFIFLDDANKENGSMRVVPKTQNKIGWIDDYQKDKSSHPDEIFIDVKKGSIVLMNANIWHSGTTNHSGARRRVLYIDVRCRSIPQLLNQQIYLDENTLKNLTEHQKFLLGVGDNDEIFEERSFGVGDNYRKTFDTHAVSEER